MRDLKKYAPYALGAAAIGGLAWYMNKKQPSKTTHVGLDLLGAEDIEIGRGGGGGHGGGGHGGHGHGGGGRFRGGWGGGGWWGGGPYWYPYGSEGYEIDELFPPPTAGEVAAELAKHLNGHGA